MFNQLVGKTISKVETKNVQYYADYEYHTTLAEWVYFTDGTGMIWYAEIIESPSRHWIDSAEQCMEWMDKVCMQCGMIRPRPNIGCGDNEGKHTFLNTTTKE